ncbi:MAG: glutamine amidotransferase [Pseudomonadota bacterium]
MSRPFLVIQLRPEDTVADEELRAIAEHAGLAESEYVRVRAEKSALPAIEFDLYSGIIVGGSPFDISTPAENKSELQRQVEQDFAQLLKQVEDRDFPFLGCCSGNGLLGAHCGAVVSRRYGESVGLAEVTLTEAGKADPLLAGFPDRFPVLLGHKEACDGTPSGTDLLATGEHCPVQMFRLRKNIYATQFHPEADAEGFRLRIEVYKHHGYFPAEDADRLTEVVSSQPVPESNKILRRFVDRYKR